MVISNIPKELQSKVEAFLNAVETNFAFLADYGYKIKEERIATKYVVKNIIEVLFTNETLNRIVLIHYQPNDINNKVSDYLSVSIFNGKLEGKELVLKKYLKKYKSDVDIEHLTYPNLNGKTTFKENMNISIAGFAYFLKDFGIYLLDGAEWEDGLFYDWSSAEKMLYKEQKKIIDEDDKTDE